MSTCAQPQGHPTQQISISLSPQENHPEYHLKPDSTESIRQETTCHDNSVQSLTYTHHMGTFTPHRGTHHIISVQRGTIHPSHGHTQHMGSLTGRLTQSVSWRMSHEAVIINTPSQLGRHSPPGQVSHGSTQTSSWQAVW
jgi:hypothetical protein